MRSPSAMRECAFCGTMRATLCERGARTRRDVWCNVTDPISMGILMRIALGERRMGGSREASFEGLKGEGGFERGWREGLDLMVVAWFEKEGERRDGGVEVVREKVEAVSAM